MGFQSCTDIHNVNAQGKTITAATTTTAGIANSQYLREKS